MVPMQLECAPSTNIRPVLLALRVTALRLVTVAIFPVGHGVPEMSRGDNHVHNADFTGGQPTQENHNDAPVDGAQFRDSPRPWLVARQLDGEIHWVLQGAT